VRLGHDPVASSMIGDSDGQVRVEHRLARSFRDRGGGLDRGLGAVARLFELDHGRALVVGGAALAALSANSFTTATNTG
jgi:hypothetical protein